MKSRLHLRTLVAPLGVLVLLPLACERADHDVARGQKEKAGSGGNAAVGGSSGGMVGDGDGDTGGASSGGLGTGGGMGGGFVLDLPNPLLETCSNNLGGMGGVPSVGDPDGNLLIDDFDDMDNRIQGNGLSGRWESHNDNEDATEEAGMQTPQGGFRWPELDWSDNAFDTGRDGTGSSLHMTGSGFSVWGSGQALYFAQDDDGLACLFDGSAYAGLTFWARGHVTPDSDDVVEQPRPHELGQLRVKVVDLDVVSNGGDKLEPGATAGGRCNQEVDRCWDSPVSRVELNEDTECWQRYVLPFSEMKGLEWSTWDGEDTFDVENLDPSEIFQLAFEVSEKQHYEIWIDDISFYVEDDVPTPETMCP